VNGTMKDCMAKWTMITRAAWPQQFPLIYYGRPSLLKAVVEGKGNSAMLQSCFTQLLYVFQSTTFFKMLFLNIIMIHGGFLQILIIAMK